MAAGAAAFAALVTTLGLSTLGAQEPSGYERRVLLENDSVQVVLVRYAPGAASPLHSHEFPGRSIYFLTGGTFELLPDGDENRVKRVTAEAGQVIWRPAETHIVRNAGSAEAEILEVEVKNLGPGG